MTHEHTFNRSLGGKMVCGNCLLAENEVVEKESRDALAADVAKFESGEWWDENWYSAPEAVPRSAESTPITMRMPRGMRTILKAFATREGIGYQVLIKRWLDDRIREERDKLRGTKP